MFVRWKRTRRFGKFEEQFPEAIELMARALRAGHAFPTGIHMVADEIPSPVGAEFKLLYDRQNFGMPLQRRAERHGRARADPRRQVLRDRRPDAA